MMHRNAPRTPRCGLLAGLLLFAAAAAVHAEDALELEGMAVVGNRELPKALFIVPWQDAEAALVPERPVNSLVNDALQPIDPEVFRRRLQYYDLVHNKE